MLSRRDGVNELYRADQPIIQIKELEVDSVRYNQWKESLKREAMKRVRRKDGK